MGVSCVTFSEMGWLECVLPCVSVVAWAFGARQTYV